MAQRNIVHVAVGRLVAILSIEPMVWVGGEQRRYRMWRKALGRVKVLRCGGHQASRDELIRRIDRTCCKRRGISGVGKAFGPIAMVVRQLASVKLLRSRFRLVSVLP